MTKIVFILFGFVIALSAGANIGSQRSIFNQNLGAEEQFENFLALSLIKGIERRGQSSHLLRPVLPKLPDPYDVEDKYYNFDSENVVGTMTTCNSVLTGGATVKDDLTFDFGVPADVKFAVEIESLHLEGQHDAKLQIDGDTLDIVSRGDYTVDIKGTKVDVFFEVLLYPNGAFDIKSASVDFSFVSLAMNTTETIASGEPLDWEAFNEGIKDLFDQLWERMKPNVDKKVHALAVDYFSQCNANTMLAGDLTCIRRSGKSSVDNQIFHQLKNFDNINEPTCPAQPPPPPPDHSYVIQSDNATNEGKWASELERCPGGSFANGFQVRTEKYQFGADDTAMNGLRLFCSNTGVSITSLEGYWGKYGKTYNCPGNEKIKGFQLRVERSGNVDDTATNNIRMICSGGKSIEGDGLDFGSWRSIFTCKDNFAACGLRTQIEPDQSPTKDDTALNNIALLCCPL